MARHSAIPPETLDEILSWFSPDREISAEMYVQLRHNLEKIFFWRKCSDPEGLTDEVFDRVARKISTLKLTYEGDPRLYFHAIANKLVKEDLKQIKTHVSLDDVDLPQKGLTEIEDETPKIEECLEICLQKLTMKNQELILAYYAKERQAKIDHRNTLAHMYGISVKALRVRAFRIRLSLESCIERCLASRSEPL